MNKLENIVKLGALSTNTGIGATIAPNKDYSDDIYAIGEIASCPEVVEANLGDFFVDKLDCLDRAKGGNSSYLARVKAFADDNKDDITIKDFSREELERYLISNRAYPTQVLYCWLRQLEDKLSNITRPIDWGFLTKELRDGVTNYKAGWEKFIALNPKVPCSVERNEDLEVLDDEELVSLIRHFANFTHVWIGDFKGVRAKGVSNLLAKLHLTKMRNDERMDALVNLIIKDKCDYRRLKTFVEKVDVDKFFELGATPLHYLSIATNRDYDNVVRFANEYNYQVITDLVCYALANKKFAFLDVFERNIDAFEGVKVRPHQSFLFNSCLRETMNLNEINDKDFKEFVGIENISWTYDDKLTPKEVLAIAKGSGDFFANKKYIFDLYKNLDCKVDDKILIVKQLYKVVTNCSSLNMERLGKKLSVCNLVRRKEKLGFRVDNATLIEALSLDEKYEDIVSQATSQLDLSFIVRNRDVIDLNVSLKENLDNYLSTDKDCKRLFDILDLSCEFKNKYENTIKEFCIKGNASKVVAYYDGNGDITRVQRDAILKIAKAAMTGDMETFKFYDLEKELEHTLTTRELDVWKDNKTMTRGGYYFYESYSFEDTMNIGVVPNTTCMNYKSGMYRKCLLANFDSNKKVIFIKKDDLIVGRAIIRLTKSLREDENLASKSVAFLDVENHSTNISKGEEVLTIFLERFYSAHISGNEESKVRAMLCELVNEKAKEMSARFLASRDYYVDTLKEVKMKVFISHTKNGVQYMDSFSGVNTVDNEGGYKVCYCGTFSDEASNVA